jgi:hypothetical protein
MADGESLGVSTSYSNAQKTSIGPVTFGGVSFGSNNAAPSTVTVLAVLGALLVAVFFFWKRK